jgi:hypothetical protein
VAPKDGGSKESTRRRSEFVVMVVWREPTPSTGSPNP